MSATITTGSGHGRLRRIGLTGGIGSGKSTVARMWRARFASQLIDADAISRSLTAAGGAAIEPIAAHFGDSAIGADGAMDRDRMRARVFADPAARQQLQAILHPLIQQAMVEALCQAAQQGFSSALLDIPLLVESTHWRDRLDAVIVVDCPEALQILRVMQRSGLSESVTRSIIANQASRSQRLAAADTVICNGDIPLLELEQQVIRAGEVMLATA
nr:dephospho-CoA kinase [Corticibacter populi]